MLVNDRLHPVAPEHADGRVLRRLRARGSRLVVEDRHLPHDLAGTVPGEGDLVTVVVEMNADLALENNVQLRADVALAEDRLALDVVPRHHQAIDARELFESEGAEQRNALERDQLFHALAWTAGSRISGLLDPLVGMVRECFELGMSQRASRS